MQDPPIVKVAKKVYDKMCNNLLQRGPNTLQEISLLTIGRYSS